MSYYTNDELDSDTMMGLGDDFVGPPEPIIMGPPAPGQEVIQKPANMSNAEWNKIYAMTTQGKMSAVDVANAIARQKQAAVTSSSNINKIFLFGSLAVLAYFLFFRKS